MGVVLSLPLLVTGIVIVAYLGTWLNTLQVRKMELLVSRLKAKAFVKLLI